MIFGILKKVIFNAESLIPTNATSRDTLAIREERMRGRERERERESGRVALFRASGEDRQLGRWQRKLINRTYA